MLTISNLSLFYDELKALHEVSLEVKKGQWVSVIGSNGAGKSSLIRAISGIHPPASGTITFKDTDITYKKSYEICKLGLAHVAEGRQIFPTLTVQENLEVAAFAANIPRKEIANQLEKAYTLFPKLKERFSQAAGTLSGGEQQMLAIGRAVIINPQLLMCDEPSLGLSPLLVSQMFDTLRHLHHEGLSILLVEQNVEASLKYADYAYVLEQGEVILHGPGKDLLGHEAIKRAYLGE